MKCVRTFVPVAGSCVYPDGAARQMPWKSSQRWADPGASIIIVNNTRHSSFASHSFQWRI